MGYNYYPFGLTFNSYLRVTASPNDYLFNGKEKQAEWGVYDFHARMYDPALGRWWVIDPLSEVQEEFSPYHFSYNNPILYNDPTGMIGENSNQNITTWVHDKENDRWLWIEDGYFFTFEVSAEEFDAIEEKGSIKGTSAYGRWFLNAIGVELTKQDDNTPDFLQWFYDDVGEAAVLSTQGQYAEAIVNIGAGKLKKLKKLVRWVRKQKGNVKIPGTAKGGQPYENRNGKLPKKDADGKPITYTKYDVNPAPQHGSTRGNERMVIGSDGKAYHTNDHYESFTPFKY